MVRSTLLLTVALGLIAPALAQETASPPLADAPPSYESDTQPPDQTPTDEPTPPPSERPRTYGTADEVLEAIRNIRTPSEVIRPESEVAAPPEVAGKLLAEGTPIINRSGTLVPSEDRWLFMPESDDPQVAERGIVILECQTLQQLASIVRSEPTGVSFIVSGEATVYDDQNYLFLRAALRGPGGAATAATTRSPSPAPAPSVPQSQDGAGVAAPDDDDVVAAMKNVPAPGEIVAPSGAPMPVPGTEGGLLPEGTPIVNRAARLVPAQERWMLILESDHPERPEPHMIVLECQALQQMASMVLSEPAGVVFIVSGETTVYEDRNYVYLHSAYRRPDLGNLGK